MVVFIFCVHQYSNSWYILYYIIINIINIILLRFYRIIYKLLNEGGPEAVSALKYNSSSDKKVETSIIEITESLYLDLRNFQRTFFYDTKDSIKIL